MWVLYEPVYDIIVAKCDIRSTRLLEIHQNLLDYLVRENVVLVVANEIFWIDREQVNKTLNPLWQEVI